MFKLDKRREKCNIWSLTSILPVLPKPCSIAMNFEQSLEKALWLSGAAFLQWGYVFSNINVSIFFSCFSFNTIEETIEPLKNEPICNSNTAQMSLSLCLKGSLDRKWGRKQPTLKWRRGWSLRHTTELISGRTFEVCSSNSLPTCSELLSNVFMFHFWCLSSFPGQDVFWWWWSHLSALECFTKCSFCCKETFSVCDLSVFGF